MCSREVGKRRSMTRTLSMVMGGMSILSEEWGRSILNVDAVLITVREIYKC
jgi:hypothetical protein